MGCLSAKSDTSAEQTLPPNNPPETVFEAEVKPSDHVDKKLEIPHENTVKVEAQIETKVIFFI